jgi:hypothetical protein
MTRFRITLVDQGGDAPAGRRLAQLLKCALRRFGLKCVEAVEVPEEEVAGGAEAVRGQEEDP